ncbi:hypothetical protein PR202_gb12174 [Eleusine coracana subsp. coracana]|uniref:SCP domain-containing protein n=1 Tax=Eleusine coracana subsp. coracana TaxID=191504 RepID=A0AAV5EQR0_ELECO|nr:hypothetical protein PR202_gb12174 [Eleusine coracana subsp. coracana]
MLIVEASVHILALVSSVHVAPCAAQNSPEDFVNLHNPAREEVGLDLVTWDDTVAAYAENYAAHSARATVRGVHSGGPYGENIAAGPAGADLSASVAVDISGPYMLLQAKISKPCIQRQSAAAYARRYAQQYCGLKPSPKPRPYGENGYWGSNGKSASDAVGSWMTDKPFYHHESNNSCSAPAGRSCSRYTQVVWRNTTAIGCALAVCSDDRGVFILCAYSPPGNVAGQKPY